MPCPQCGGRTDVYDSRLNMQKLVRRRRECRSCGFRFATIEVMNQYQPLGKRENPDAPAPKPPQKEVKPKEPKVTRARHTAVRDRPRRLDEDVVPFDMEPSEDLSAYIDLPRGFDD